MAELMKVGANWGGVGVFQPLTAGISGAQRVQDAHARCLDAVLSGRVWKLSGVALAPTAYVGAAGGTPLMAVHNPVNSNKIFSLLAVAVAGRAQASAAGQTGLNVWSGPSATPTGTVTNPTNAFSLNASGGGAAGIGFLNTALTGSTALALALPIWDYYWATAAGAIKSQGFTDIGGLVTIVPGNQMTIGLTVALTSATYDVAKYWEEVPFLVTI